MAKVKNGVDGFGRRNLGQIQQAASVRGGGMKSMLIRLVEKVERVNAIQHSGGKVRTEDWSELYGLTNEARGVLAKTENQITRACFVSSLFTLAVSSSFIGPDGLSRCFSFTGISDEKCAKALLKHMGWEDIPFEVVK